MQLLQKFPFLTGVPLSEIKSKQSMQIKVLNGEEIEKMRVACRVRDLLSLFCCCFFFKLYILTQNFLFRFLLVCLYVINVLRI